MPAESGDAWNDRRTARTLSPTDLRIANFARQQGEERARVERRRKDHRVSKLVFQVKSCSHFCLAWINRFVNKDCWFWNNFLATFLNRSTPITHQMQPPHRAENKLSRLHLFWATNLLKAIWILESNYKLSLRICPYEFLEIVIRSICRTLDAVRFRICLFATYFCNILDCRKAVGSRSTEKDEILFRAAPSLALRWQFIQQRRDLRPPSAEDCESKGKIRIFSISNPKCLDCSVVEQ